MTHPRTHLRRMLPVWMGVPIVVANTAALADPVYWADWRTRDNGTSSVDGVITLEDGRTVQTRISGGNNLLLPYNAGSYWYVPPGATTFTSDAVPNGPQYNASLVMMGDRNTRTLSFSEAMNGVVFSVVSLNGNSYTFDRDFTLESFGAGAFGSGTLTKEITADGRFKLVGTGEGTGTIRFSGSIQSLSWSADHDEWWQGVTVASYGLAAPVPEPASWGLMALGCVALAAHLAPRRRREGEADAR